MYQFEDDNIALTDVKFSYLTNTSKRITMFHIHVYFFFLFAYLQMSEFFMFAGIMYATVIVFAIMSCFYTYVEDRPEKELPPAPEVSTVNVVCTYSY